MTKEDNAMKLERHTQTILTAVIIGLIGWVGVTVTGTRTDLAKTAVSLDGLKDTVHKIEMRVDRIDELDRYSKEDADSALKMRDRRLDDLDRRLERLEDEVHNVPRRVMQHERAREDFKH